MHSLTLLFENRFGQWRGEHVVRIVLIQHVAGMIPTVIVPCPGIKAARNVYFEYGFILPRCLAYNPSLYSTLREPSHSRP